VAQAGAVGTGHWFGRGSNWSRNGWLCRLCPGELTDETTSTASPSRLFPPSLPLGPPPHNKHHACFTVRQSDVCKLRVSNRHPRLGEHTLLECTQASMLTGGVSWPNTTADEMAAPYTSYCSKGLQIRQSAVMGQEGAFREWGETLQGCVFPRDSTCPSHPRYFERPCIGHEG
jgi:hypothetical protein